jgi:fibronectin-binding autotransporter adhesin
VFKDIMCIKSFLPLRYLPAALALLTSLLVGQNTVQALDVTWLGTGPDDNWSSASNWDISPVDGDTLIFSGANRLVNFNDLTLSTNMGLRLDGDAFSLSGNPLTLGAGLTNSIGTNTIGMNLQWGTSGRFLNVAVDSELIIAGTNTINAGDHTYLGGGRIRLKGAHVQLSNSPATIFNSIQYVIDRGSFTNGGGVRITSGTTPTASQLILTNGATMSQIIAAGAIRVGDATGISGQFIMDNSTLRGVTNNMFIPFASGGIGSVIQRGGTNSGLVIVLCQNTTTGGTGSYDMTGGVLETTQIKKNAPVTGTASMSFDNSIVRALPGAVTAFWTNVNTAEIKSGGLTLDSNGESFTVAQAFSGAGRLTKIGSGTVTISGANTFTGGLFASGGTVTLSTANSFGGGVTLTSGTLQIAADGAIPGSLALNGGTIRGNNSTPRTNSVPVTLGGNVTFAVNSDLIFNGVATLTGSRILTVNTTNTFGGGIVESGGSYALTKAGTGNLILTSANTYSSNTTISAGSLILGASGTLPNTPSISVAAGGTFNVSALSGGFTVGSGKTLKGSGTVSGAVNVSGTLSPGTTVGTLTNNGALTLNTGSTLLWEINNAGADSVVATSLNLPATALTLDITALATLTNWNGASATNWVLVHTTGGGIANFNTSKFTITDHFSSSNSLAGGTFSVTSNGTDLVLQFSPSAGDNQARVLTTVNAGAASFSGLPNKGYTIEYTDNIGTAWQKLTSVGANGVVTTDGTGAGNFQDPTTPLPAHRFYRIINP